jgi:uncharacterized protein (DUF1330 family)
MLTRIRLRRLAGLARRDLPRPVDVVNLITTARFDRYRWYALLVLPVMTAAGGRVLWMARLERVVAGEPQAEKLLLVRYPSHRRFVAMVLNPYYLAINRLREAGVRRLEASFTHASCAAADLAARRELLGVHFASPPGNDVLEAVRSALGARGYELVYATRTVADMDFLARPEPSDPNPLTFPQLALFAGGDEPAGPELATALADVTDGCAIAVYRRESSRAYRPSLR